jgi:hypothetical protein
MACSVGRLPGSAEAPSEGGSRLDAGAGTPASAPIQSRHRSSGGGGGRSRVLGMGRISTCTGRPNRLALGSRRPAGLGDGGPVDMAALAGSRRSLPPIQALLAAAQPSSAARYPGATHVGGPNAHTLDLNSGRQSIGGRRSSRFQQAAIAPPIRAPGWDALRAR